MLERGSLTVIGGLGAVGSLAAVWGLESRVWQGLRLLGRTGKASEQTLGVLSESSQVQIGCLCSYSFAAMTLETAPIAIEHYATLQSLSKFSFWHAETGLFAHIAEVRCVINGRQGRLADQQLQQGCYAGSSLACGWSLAGKKQI